eukprot:Hpha_TRINITY_DN5444_c0_g1::TRINITY_DN5444_c0_g1_i2::g.192444::m.192444
MLPMPLPPTVVRPLDPALLASPAVRKAAEALASLRARPLDAPACPGRYRAAAARGGSGPSTSVAEIATQFAECMVQLAGLCANHASEAALAFAAAVAPDPIPPAQPLGPLESASPVDCSRGSSPLPLPHASIGPVPQFF